MKIVIQNKTLGIEHDGKFTPAKGVMGHKTPDIDLLVAIWLFKYFGVKIGRVAFFSAGEEGLVNGKTARKWLEEGFILIDVGAGESKRPEPGRLEHFDHHPSSYYPGQCATSMCFDFLCSYIDIPEKEKEILEKLVSFVRKVDLRGGQQFLDMSDICKVLAKKIPELELCNHVFLSLDAFVENQKNRVSNEKLLLKLFSDFARNKKLPYLMQRYVNNLKNGKIPDMPNILGITSEKTAGFVKVILNGAYDNQMMFKRAEQIFQEIEKIPLKKDMFMVVAETDNDQFLKASLRGGVTIIVIKNSLGHVQIFTQKKDNVNISDIAAAIRFEEQRAQTENNKLINFGSLHVDGTSSVAKNWYLFKQGKALFNGSNTTTSQKTTALSLELIVDIILKTVRHYMPSCSQGTDKCQKLNCPIYYWGLERCQQKFRQEGSDIERLKNAGTRKGETLLLVQ